MKDIIKVNNLSKCYRIGLKGKQAETLAGQIGNMIKSPWQNLKRLRELNRFGLEDESVFWALKDINFEVKEGEVLGIIGKNGAGKSTLLKILSQITEPTSGKIEIHGRVASLLEVGTGFHPELSGRENIYMNGTILGMTRKEIDSQLEEIIDFSGVEKFIDTPVKFYSSGMKVRLGFSVAAHLDPEILIIDEVLAVGDYEFQTKCLGKMKDIAKNGRTVLFVSHNLEAIKSLCTRVIFLVNGKIEFNAEPVLSVKKYLNGVNIVNNSVFWNNFNRPGNQYIKVNNVDATSNSFNNNGFYDRLEDVVINIDFELLKDEIALNLSLFVNTESNETILNTHSQIPVPVLNKGVYSATCVLPGGFLNDGVFRISMKFVKDTTSILFSMEDVLTFELMDTEVRKSGWFGKYSGFVRPKLNFKINV